MGAINVAEILTIQDLANGHLDVKALGEAANGDENTIVTTRTGNTYPSAERAIKTMFENGGLPAKPFQTKAKMITEGASLLDGQLAQVYNETANNGLYVKTAGAWVKSAYDPLTQANIYTDSYLSTVLNKPTKTTIDLLDPSLIISNANPYTFGAKYIWTVGAEQQAVLLPVIAGDIYLVSAKVNIEAVIVLYNSEKTTPVNQAVVDTGATVKIIPNNQSYIITVPTGVNTLHIAKKISGGQIILPTIYKATNVLLNTGNVINTLDSASTNMPLSANAGKLLSDRIKEVEKWSITPVNVNINLDAITTNVDGIFVALNPSSPSGYNWAKKTGDRLLRISVDGHRFIKLRSNDTGEAILVFTNNEQDPSVGVITNSDKVVVVAKKTDINITIPSGFKYVLVSAVVYGAIAKPVSFIFTDNIALSSSDILNEIPLGGSIYPVSANVALDLQRQINSSTPKNIPKIIPVDQKSPVFATHKNFILKDEKIDGLSNIFISTDLGATWTNFPNTIGKITNFHIFVDGSIMLCGINKVYYVNSTYTGLIESVVTDHDGSIFAPTTDTEHNYYSLIFGNQTQYVGDTEVFVWGEYKNLAPVRLWYTTDRGKTVKCAIKTGTTVVDGVARVIRHFHMVTQRRQDEKFYITTGDGGRENSILTGSYNVASDSWTWDLLASGDTYKFGDILFDDHYAYLLTDFNTVTTRPLAGMYRVAIENLGDFSKYHAVFKPVFADMGDGTLSRYIEDSNGIKIILPDNAGHGRMWIAVGDMNFKLHTTSPLTSFMNRLGTNDLGDMYCNDPFADPEPTGSFAQKLYINHGSHNLTKILRDAGFSDFMRKRTLLTDTWIR